jgi:hypothetical protein
MSDQARQMTEEVELELRGRLTLLEDRSELVFWLAVGAHVAALTIGVMVLISRRRAG